MTSQLRMITSPEEYEKTPGRVSLFLAGGISGCPDWQSLVMNTVLVRYPIDLLNPRRVSFNVGDPAAAPAQIKWEFDHLRRADGILFWFCKETIQPIALFELGAWSMTNKPLFVGADPDYPRLFDIQQQLPLARPELSVDLMGLAALCWDVERWYIDNHMARAL